MLAENRARGPVSRLVDHTVTVALRDVANREPDGATASGGSPPIVCPERIGAVVNVLPNPPLASAAMFHRNTAPSRLLV